MGYDAFVSYSHAADGQLAPALQRGLERLARPWYRTRALAVFRDETGLAVSPHLWAAIVRALDDSEWFVVLCSPEAARSEWVQREIDYWLAHKAPDQILLVLTDGDLVWDRSRGDFDPERSTALPPALFRKFDDEPRHLDLRWARGEEQLDLRHARFRPAVGELAAPIRHMAREELEAEDVRQHRRTVRLARGATSVMVLLLVLALTFGIVALQQRGDARRQAANARREADAARRAATGMLGRGLAAEALNALHDGRPDLAQLLALEAYRTDPSVYSRSSLLQAVVDQPALEVQLHGLTTGPAEVAISADGGLVAADGTLWDRRSGLLVARQPKFLGPGSLEFADHGRLLLSASYTPSGRLGIWDIVRGRLLAPLPVNLSWAASAASSTLADLDASGVLRLFDLETGKSLGSIETGRTGPLAMSADGTTVAQLSPAAATPGRQAVIGVHAWTVATGHEVGPGCSTTAETLTSPSVLADDATVGFVTAGAFTADSQTSSVFRCDVRTGSITSRAFTLHADQQVAGISPDARIVAVRLAGGAIQLNDATGKTIGGPIDAPLTERMSLTTVAFSADGRWFTATGSGGDLRVWRTPPDLPLGKLLDLGSKFEPRRDLHQTPEGRVIGVTPRGDVVDVETKESLGRIAGASLTSLSPDGRLLAGLGSAGLSVVDLRRRTTETFPADRLACKPPEAIGIAPDDKTLVLNCNAPASTSVGPSGSDTSERIQTVDISSSPWRPSPPIEAPVWSERLAFSPDGRVLAASESSGAGSGLQLFDVRGTRLRARATLYGYGNDVAFTPDSRSLIWSHDGRIDIVSLSAIGMRVTAFAPPTGKPSGRISLAPDGSLLAASDGSQIRLWDMSTKQLLGDIPGSSDPACCTALTVTSQSITAVGGQSDFTNPAIGDLVLVRFDLDANKLIRRACTRANRNLTRAEWVQYVGSTAYRAQCPGLP